LGFYRAFCTISLPEAAVYSLSCIQEPNGIRPHPGESFMKRRF
jgi:hypothetical protein